MAMLKSAGGALSSLSFVDDLFAATGLGLCWGLLFLFFEDFFFETAVAATSSSSSSLSAAAATREERHVFVRD